MSGTERKGLKRSIDTWVFDRAKTDEARHPLFWRDVIRFEHWSKRKRQITVEIIKYLEQHPEDRQTLVEELTRAKSIPLCEPEVQHETNIAALYGLDQIAAEALLVACLETKINQSNLS